MFLLIDLNLHNEPCTCGIFAINIEYGVPVEPCSPKLLVVYNTYFLDRAFQLFGEESVEKKQKQFCALLVSKGLFEGEIQSERSKLRFSELLGHNMPPYKKSYNKFAPLWNNIEKGVDNMKKALIKSLFVCVLALTTPAFADLTPTDSAKIQALFERGITYAKKGNYDKAINDFEAVLKMDPNNTYAKQFLEEVRRIKAGVKK